MNLLTGDATAVPGFTSMPFDVGKAVSIFHLFNAMGVVYGLGSKAADIHAPTDADFRFLPGPNKPELSIDCSGFSRLLTFKCSGADAGPNAPGGGVVLPDGSVNQNDWLAAHGFKHDPIAAPESPAYLYGLDRRFVYECFCRAGTRGEHIGHVWLCVFWLGRWWTLESCGGVGPTMRPHDTPILAHIVTDVYPIASAL